jgi:excisionase family DNA binding protein
MIHTEETTMSICLPKKANKAAKPATAEHAKPYETKLPKTPVSLKPKDFFTAAELALRWGMSERHVRRLTESGELRTHRFGKAVRISLSDVLMYEASRIQVI